MKRKITVLPAMVVLSASFFALPSMAADTEGNAASPLDGKITKNADGMTVQTAVCCSEGVWNVMVAGYKGDSLIDIVIKPSFAEEKEFVLKGEMDSVKIMILETNGLYPMC